MGTGYLKVQVRTAGSSLPVKNAVVKIRSNDGGQSFRLTSDIDGETEAVAVYAPDLELTLNPDYNAATYSTFEVEIQAEDNMPYIEHGVQVFAERTSLLNAQLHPLTESETDDRITPVEHIYVPPHDLKAPSKWMQQGPAADPQDKSVFIPDYITVHLGTPTSNARNVRVPFVDYIKNVASGEIYPTWPESSLRANILCIITYALNRIYTQWYPSRGLNFDITSSTAYDQTFVDGRNIFQNISVIVDEIFNNFARRRGHSEPFFTQFCNGTTVTCPGLSQWGTVTLANQGLTPLEMLRYYYFNDIEVNETNNIQGIPVTYPSTPLQLGSSGDDVRTMQNYLNRIRANYPGIPQITNPNGVFGQDTQDAVRMFQSVFDLTPDGIIGKGTWYEITRIFVGVTRLAELDSEGIRLGIGSEPPSSVVRLGSRGRDVVELQYILNVIAEFFNDVPPVIQNSVFDAQTQESVKAFQQKYNLTPDGIVGPVTWSKLYDVYNGIKENVEIPPAPPTGTAPAYPGTPLRQGSRGSDVMLMQRYLNAIADQYPSIPRLSADGIFGPRTQQAVIAFQNQFGLTPDGIIGPATWEAIVRIYQSGGIGPRYPGSPLSLGARGDNVVVMQSFLNTIANVYPSIPRVAEDGIFGPATRAAVVAFQRQFGLDQDGIIGPVTWNAIVDQRNKAVG